MQARNLMHRLVDYNAAILQQAQDVLQWYIDHADGADFAYATGPHMRHVLEHYEEFLGGLEARVLDYDRRVRDRSVETSAGTARSRFTAVVQRLEALCNDAAWPEQVAVMLCGGLEGDERFMAMSTPARELLFLASHAIHHYALLKPMLNEAGCPVGADFGKAPGTIHHERTQPGQH